MYFTLLDGMMLASIVLFVITVVAVVRYRREYAAAEHFHQCWLDVDTARNEAEQNAYKANQEVIRLRASAQSTLLLVNGLERDIERMLTSHSELMQLLHERASEMQQLEREVERLNELVIAKNVTITRSALSRLGN